MRWIVFVLLFVPLMASAQKQAKLKRKYFGKYRGTIASYEIEVGTELVKVSETPIYVTIERDNQVAIVIGNNKLYGKYDVLFKADSYYLLDCKMQGQLASERILVYKRGKHLSRDGMFPQPVTELKKYK